VQSYQPTLEALNQVEADALTFETRSSGTGDLKAIGEVIKDKKVVIGVIDHHTLQVERPDEIAALIREALKHIPPERLVISSDCGMGREGMGRRKRNAWPRSSATRSRQRRRDQVGSRTIRPRGNRCEHRLAERRRRDRVPHALCRTGMTPTRGPC
jgi:hypothetical protein